MERLRNIHRASTECCGVGCAFRLGMFRLDMVGHVDALWAGCNQAFGGWPCAVLWALVARLFFRRSELVGPLLVTCCSCSLLCRSDFGSRFCIPFWPLSLFFIPFCIIRCRLLQLTWKRLNGGRPGTVIFASNQLAHRHC